MKHINLLSVVQAHKNLQTDLFHNFLGYYGILATKIRDYELQGIDLLVTNLLFYNHNISITDGFYLSFSIPQIGKEFDLLRFGHNSIINIEIKSNSTIDKVLKQQERNHYYLSFLNKDTHIYTYVSCDNKIYKFIHGHTNNVAKEVNIAELFNKLLEQEVIVYDNLDKIFTPAYYLVSPFNSTDKFITGKYFLTVQQENIYSNILKQLSNDAINFIAIKGHAGTGKTLLTYHIAKELQNTGHKVLILHCAKLNNGHKKLQEEWGWNIYMTRYAPDVNDYDIIIIDEAQRLHNSQFTTLVQNIRYANKKCLFAYDENQYLHEVEKKCDIKTKIETELSCSPFKLTDKIRTNKEVAFFIKQLFDTTKNISQINYSNINLTYCKDCDSALSILNMLHQKGWKVPNYTPGTISYFVYQKYTSEDTDTAHSVIGQEFMKVVVVLDESFGYDSFGKIIANNTYYSQKQMLYQIITRTIKELHIVIINNDIMLNRCLQILGR